MNNVSEQAKQRLCDLAGARPPWTRAQINRSSALTAVAKYVQDVSEAIEAHASLAPFVLPDAAPPSEDAAPHITQLREKLRAHQEAGEWKHAAFVMAEISDETAEYLNIRIFELENRLASLAPSK